MSNTDLINSADAAQLVGVRVDVFMTARPYLADFPQPAAKKGNTLLYSRPAIARWSQGKNVKALFNCAHMRSKTESKAAAKAKTDAFNAQARAFAAGAFLPQAQKQTLEYKKLAARATQPKTTRVQVVPDWMHD